MVKAMNGVKLKKRKRMMELTLMLKLKQKTCWLSQAMGDDMEMC